MYPRGSSVAHTAEGDARAIWKARQTLARKRGGKRRTPTTERARLRRGGARDVTTPTAAGRASPAPPVGVARSPTQNAVRPLDSEMWKWSCLAYCRRERPSFGVMLMLDFVLEPRFGSDLRKKVTCVMFTMRVDSAKVPCSKFNIINCYFTQSRAVRFDLDRT